MTCAVRSCHESPFHGPRRLWSLADMYQLYAEPFLRVQQTIKLLDVTLQGLNRPPPMPSESHDSSREVMPLKSAHMDSFENDLRALGLTSALAEFKRLRALFERGVWGDKWHQQETLRHAMDFNSRILDEMGGRFFLALTAVEANYFDTAAIYWRPITEKISGIEEDLVEAAKCLAVSRTTAAVFHLMRAMEAALRIAATRLGATIDDKHGKGLSWGKILGNLGDKIGALPVGDARAKWFEAHALLYSVKEAWRNDTMHPKQTYTFEQAQEVYGTTKAFLLRLAQLI